MINAIYQLIEYINEAIRVLEYNGEIIISDSADKYNTIREYIDSLRLYIKFVDYKETNRWFYLYVINDTY